MIPVTKPFLPPQQIYQHYLDGIWKRQWLTNMGPLASDLEMQLKDLVENFAELGLNGKNSESHGFWKNKENL